MSIASTLRAMSDHQILGFVTVLHSDDHVLTDQTAFYVAAHAEAQRRNLLED